MNLRSFQNFNPKKPSKSLTIKKLIQISLEAFSLQGGVEVKSFSKVDILMLCYAKGEIKGYLTAKKVNTSTCYLSRIAVTPEYGSMGIASRLMEKLLSDYKVIVLTTQNPNVFCLMQKYMKVFPSPENQKCPTKKTLRLVRKILKNRNGQLDELSFVVKNLFPGNGLYPDGIPLSKDQIVNEWFKNSLEIKNCKSPHGFILIGTKK